MTAARTVATAIALTCLAASGAHAQGRHYAMSGYERNCPLQTGGEGIIAIGAGTFSLTETHYDRQSPLNTLPDGWSSATYAIMSEGESYGAETVRLRVTDRQVEIVLQDGRTVSGARCR
ncbi:hypothetical protein [Paracoccus sp. Ld10]|uniref:hypothetical protein n=1 Tax=Paracoccus sp. Ld10 TaxID=649158 RepID=UPI0038676F57